MSFDVRMKDNRRKPTKKFYIWKEDIGFGGAWHLAMRIKKKYWYRCDARCFYSQQEALSQMDEIIRSNDHA